MLTRIGILASKTPAKIDRPAGRFLWTWTGAVWSRSRGMSGGFVVVVNEGAGVDDKQRLIFLRVQPLYCGEEASLPPTGTLRGRRGEDQAKGPSIRPFDRDAERTAVRGLHMRVVVARTATEQPNQQVVD